MTNPLLGASQLSKTYGTGPAAVRAVRRCDARGGAVGDRWLMLAAIGGVAASVGVLSPILTYWISTRAGTAQGWELGKQAAAASLGITAGSAAGGLLFDIGGAPGASFVVTAGLVAVGLFISLKLPRALVPDVSGHQARTKDTP